MAVTSVHAIKSTLTAALDYIEDPEKTEYQNLVSGYQVDPLSASVEFALTAAAAKQIKGDYTKVGGSENLAYHMIQSFAASDNITPEQAHEIGRQMADELLGGKYEYVLATHIDKGHIHNHIIFNATSFFDYKKWDPGYKGKVAYQIQRISDRLCEEHGLDVLKESWTHRLKRLIDQAIEETDNYQAFLKKLKSIGVEVKDGARISFRLTDEGMKSFRRGDKIKGGDYSRDGIMGRLAKREPITPEGKYAAQISRSSRWEQKARLNMLAQTISTIRSEHITQDDDFSLVTAKLESRVADTYTTIKDLENKIGQYAQAANYLTIVQQAREILSDPKNAMLQTSSGELRYGMEFHALERLRQFGVDPGVDPEKVKILIEEQKRRAEELKSQAAKIDQRIKALKDAQNVIFELRDSRDEKEQGKKQEQDR